MPIKPLSPAIIKLIISSSIYIGFFAITCYLEPRYFRQRSIIGNVRLYSKHITIDEIEQVRGFNEYVDMLKVMREPPYIIFYDSSNSDVLLNHICNLKYMGNALSRLALISFDQQGYEELIHHHPDIPNIVVNLESIKMKLKHNVQENRSYVLYQLILLTRARICAILAHRQLNFWAMQQDSLWIEDFSKLRVEERYSNAHLIFDTVGNDHIGRYKRMHGWICGSTFFVRASPLTTQFFLQVDEMMRIRQSPDSAIMTYLCGHQNYRCEKMPRWIISSSDYFLGPRDQVPIMLQVDSDQKKMTKMQLFRSSNFIFSFPNGTCDRRSVLRLRESVKTAMTDKIESLYYEENIYNRFIYKVRQIFNIDRYNNKLFLRVHEGLI